jgi:hypothetical protein
MFVFRLSNCILIWTAWQFAIAIVICKDAVFNVFFYININEFNDYKYVRESLSGASCLGYLS